MVELVVSDFFSHTRWYLDLAFGFSTTKQTPPVAEVTRLSDIGL